MHIICLLVDTLLKRIYFQGTWFFNTSKPTTCDWGISSYLQSESLLTAGISHHKVLDKVTLWVQQEDRLCKVSLILGLIHRDEAYFPS